MGRYVASGDMPPRPVPASRIDGLGYSAFAASQMSERRNHLLISRFLERHDQ